MRVEGKPNDRSVTLERHLESSLVAANRRLLVLQPEARDGQDERSTLRTLSHTVIIMDLIMGHHKKGESKAGASSI